MLLQPKPLSNDEKEILLETRNSNETKCLLRLLEILVGEQERSILQVDLRTTDDRQLTLAKARAEGAAKLLRDVSTFLNKAPKDKSKS